MNHVFGLERATEGSPGLLSSAPLGLNRRKISAFTLVELLVVVAILVLLISLLLPPLNRAKEEAKIAVCLTNLRALGVTFTNYTVSNNHWYPAGAAYGGSSGEYTWDSILQPYYQDMGLIHCPSDKLTRNYSSWMEGTYGCLAPRSYAINLDVSWMGPSTWGDNNGYGGNYGTDRWPGYVHKTTDVEIPGETILIGEQWENTYWTSYWRAGIYHYYCGVAIFPYDWGNYTEPGRLPTYYHRNNDTANFLFCDGHATALREDNPKLTTTTSEDPADAGYYWRREK